MGTAPFPLCWYFHVFVLERRERIEMSFTCYVAQILQNGATYRVVSFSILHFLFKIHVPVVSIACPYDIHSIPGHHTFIQYGAGREGGLFHTWPGK